MADFEAARSFILLEVQARLGFWRQLSWVLAAFADCNVEAARQAVARTLNTFDSSPQDTAQHHRIAWSWLAPGSDERRALDAFRDGASLAEYPTLYQAIAELAFICIAEREQEGQHSIVKRACSYRFRGPYVSLHIRGRPITDYLLAPPAALN